MHRHHFPSYLPQNLFQFGIVNRGNGSLIRFGAVNYNPFDFWDEPGIDFGILNKGNYVQFGIAGFATNKGCQMNLVNSGEEVPQFGLINIRTAHYGTEPYFQCGIVNFSSHETYEWQWGIVNIASRAEMQIGLVNIGRSDVSVRSAHYTRISIGNKLIDSSIIYKGDCHETLRNDLARSAVRFTIFRLVLAEILPGTAPELCPCAVLAPPTGVLAGRIIADFCGCSASQFRTVPGQRGCSGMRKTSCSAEQSF